MEFSSTTNGNEDAIYQHCLDLQEKYPEFYSEFKTSLLVAKLLMQLIRRNIGNWDMLAQPLHMFDQFY